MLPDANSLSDEQLLGLVTFFVAVLSAVFVPFWTARGVEWCRDFVTDSKGDGLIVFDLLLGGAFAQATMVLLHALDRLLTTRYEPGTARLGAWAHALAEDHVLVGRGLMLGAIVLLVAAVAVGLRIAFDANGRALPAGAVALSTRIGLMTLWTVVLANVFMVALISFLGLR